MRENPDSLLAAAHSVEVSQTRVHGLYGVLGDYDFVCILDSPDNAGAARFSVELGVEAGVQVKTLPAIPIGRLEEALEDDSPSADYTSARGGGPTIEIGGGSDAS